MSNILNLISNIDTENNVEAEKIFTSIILDKISDKMDAMRTNLAKDMFSESKDEGLNLAKDIAKKHKDYKVTSSEGEHFIHHKDDEDGADGSIRISHKNNKFHSIFEPRGQMGDAQHNTGTRDEISSHVHSLFKEDVDYDEVLDILENSQLDEISKATLGSYLRKAKDDNRTSVSNFIKANDTSTKVAMKDRINKRTKGVDMAIDKAATKCTTEEVELDSALEALDNIELDESLRRKIRSVFPTMARAIDNSMYKLKNDFTTPKERHTLRVMKRIGKKVFNEDVAAIDEARYIVSKHENGNRKAVVYKNPETNEHQTEFYTNGKHHKDATSYDNGDKEGKTSSQDTARHWISKSSSNLTKEEVDQSAIDKFYTDNK